MRERGEESQILGKHQVVREERAFDAHIKIAYRNSVSYLHSFSFSV